MLFHCFSSICRLCQHNKDPTIEVPKAYDYGRCLQINNELSSKIDIFFPSDSIMLTIKAQSSALTDKAKKEARKTIFKGSLVGGLFGMVFCDIFWLLSPDNVPNGKFFAIASPIAFGSMSLVTLSILLHEKKGTSISYGLQKEFYQLLTDYNSAIKDKGKSEGISQDTISTIHND